MNAAADIPADNHSSSEASQASLSAASSSNFSGSIDSEEGSSSSLSTDAAAAAEVPLVLRLFEHQVRYSRFSDTWRYLLRAVTSDIVHYLTGRCQAAGSSIEDPFYPGLVHEIWLDKQQEQECLRWRITVRGVCTASLAVDSSESSVLLTRCSSCWQHRREASSSSNSSSCCHVHCWPVESLIGSFAQLLDVIYRRGQLVCSERPDQMRGKYHGCRRG